MRGYEYREFLGNKGFYGNAELRFPLINAMATPIGILGGIRGVFFFNVGGASLENQSFKFWDKTPFRIDPLLASNGQVIRPGQTIEGFRLVDARVIRHRPRDVRPRVPGTLRLVVPHALQQGVGRRALLANRRSAALRKARFTAWIGYDFDAAV
jgi:hypothetical protein